MVYNEIRLVFLFNHKNLDKLQINFTEQEWFKKIVNHLQQTNLGFL